MPCSIHFVHVDIAVAWVSVPELPVLFGLHSWDVYLTFDERPQTRDCARLAGPGLECMDQVIHGPSTVGKNQGWTGTRWLSNVCCCGSKPPCCPPPGKLPDTEWVLWQVPETIPCT